MRAWCRAQSGGREAGGASALGPQHSQAPIKCHLLREALPATPVEGQGHRQATQSQQGTHNSLPGVRAKRGDPCRSLANGQTKEVMSRDTIRGPPATSRPPHRPPQEAGGGGDLRPLLALRGLRTVFTLYVVKKKKNSFRTGENDMKLTYQHPQSLTGAPVCLRNNSKAEWL